jgi:integrase
MLRVQVLTGARPGEVRLMRPCEVERAPADPTAREAGVWLYRPEAHKKQHEDEDETTRVIPIGPQAQAILTPYLAAQPDPAGYVFRNRHGRPFAGEYYARFVRKARVKAGIKMRIVPNSLRKGRAVAVRKDFGLEAAQSTLGHRNRETTERFYSETPIEAAIRAAKELG